MPLDFGAIADGLEAQGQMRGAEAIRLLVAELQTRNAAIDMISKTNDSLGAALGAALAATQRHNEELEAQLAEGDKFAVGRLRELVTQRETAESENRRYRNLLDGLHAAIVAARDWRQ